MSIGLRYTTRELSPNFGPYDCSIVINPDLNAHWVEKSRDPVRAEVKTLDKVFWYMEMIGRSSAEIFFRAPLDTRGVMEVGEMVKAWAWANPESSIQNLVFIVDNETYKEFDQYFQGFWYL